MQKTDNGKHTKKTKYMIMLFANSTKGGIKQMSIGPAVIRFVMIVQVAVVAVLVVFCYKSSRQSEQIAVLEAQKQEQADKIAKLEAENADLAALREELRDKVTILSDTINQKVEEEEALEEARAAAHMPVGFPMSSSAALEEADSEEPMVKLTGSEGNSVIASGDGIVLSVATDSVYHNCIKIDHGNGYVSIYRNNGDVMVREGDEIVRGAILYVMGEENTELGYQITYDEKYIDPMELINIDG